MNRMMRIVLGLGLIGYGVYSGNSWFYLGVIPLLLGVINYCPMEQMMGGCKDGECSTGSCGTTAPKDDNTSCCSINESQEKTSCCNDEDKDSSKDSCCATPEEQIKEFQKKSTSMSFSTKKKTVVKILGTGCANCIALKKIVDEAVSQLGEDITVIKEEDIAKIMEYKVMSMPGFVINEKVISAGKLLGLEEVKEYIKKAQQ